MCTFSLGKTREKGHNLQCLIWCAAEYCVPLWAPPVETNTPRLMTVGEDPMRCPVAEDVQWVALLVLGGTEWHTANKVHHQDSLRSRKDAIGITSKHSHPRTAVLSSRHDGTLQWCTTKASQRGAQMCMAGGCGGWHISTPSQGLGEKRCLRGTE